MPGTKRASEDEPSTIDSRATKAAKKDSGKGKKQGSSKIQAPLTSKQFTEHALPLHISLTHTPPSISTGNDSEEGGKKRKDEDAGFINTLSLMPSEFSTGSYGWKGNRRITIEVENDQGKKEKLQVQLTINATVLGSKTPKEAGQKKDGEAGDDDDDDEDDEGNDNEE